METPSLYKLQNCKTQTLPLKSTCVDFRSVSVDFKSTPIDFKEGYCETEQIR